MLRLTAIAAVAVLVCSSVPAQSTFCDGADLALCPCSNPGSMDTGCDNAQGTGGVKLVLVAQTTSPDMATVTGTGFSTMGSPAAVLLRSPSIGTPVVFGDGLRCVGTTGLVRLAATVAVGGTSTHVFGHGAMSGTGAFYYQIWYRNTPSTFCDAFSAFNLSSGKRICWPPCP